MFNLYAMDSTENSDHYALSNTFEEIIQLSTSELTTVANQPIRGLGAKDEPFGDIVTKLEKNGGTTLQYAQTLNPQDKVKLLVFINLFTRLIQYSIYGEFIESIPNEAFDEESIILLLQRPSVPPVKSKLAQVLRIKPWEFSHSFTGKQNYIFDLKEQLTIIELWPQEKSYKFITENLTYDLLRSCVNKIALIIARWDIETRKQLLDFFVDGDRKYTYTPSFFESMISLVKLIPYPYSYDIFNKLNFDPIGTYSRVRDIADILTEWPPVQILEFIDTRLNERKLNIARADILLKILLNQADPLDEAYIPIFRLIANPAQSGQITLDRQKFYKLLERNPHLVTADYLDKFTDLEQLIRVISILPPERWDEFDSYILPFTDKLALHPAVSYVFGNSTFKHFHDILVNLSISNSDYLNKLLGLTFRPPWEGHKFNFLEQLLQSPDLGSIFTNYFKTKDSSYMNFILGEILSSTQIFKTNSTSSLRSGTHSTPINFEEKDLLIFMADLVKDVDFKLIDDKLTGFVLRMTCEIGMKESMNVNKQKIRSLIDKVDILTVKDFFKNYISAVLEESTIYFQKFVDNIYGILRLINVYLPNSVAYLDILPPTLVETLRSLQVSSITELEDLVRMRPTEIRDSFFEILTEIKYKDQISHANSLGISLQPYHIYIACSNGIRFDNLQNDDNFKKLYSILEEHDRWDCEPGFVYLASIFGYKNMFKYLRLKDGISLHDSVHASDAIFALYESSGLNAEDFYQNILWQVKLDQNQYPEGSSHHLLNAIANSIDKDITATFSQIERLFSIKDKLKASNQHRTEIVKLVDELNEMQQVFLDLGKVGNVFTSWNNLYSFSKLQKLYLGNRILFALQELSTDSNSKLTEYITALVYHSDSKVNLSAAIELWQKPEVFLARHASHTPREIHDRKKPSNYFNIPHLDLGAVDLRDALVEGSIDRITAFRPLSIEYELYNVTAEQLLTKIKEALGSRRENIPGNAQNEKKLFFELSKLFKSYSVNIIDYLKGSIIINSTLIQAAARLVFDKTIGLQNYSPIKFKAVITKKDDPYGVLAGDDTVNCMPFGDGKNTLYTFNPNTSQFLIRIENGEGKQRTIAQSVITKDADIGISITSLDTEDPREALLNSETSLSRERYLACDNIEIAPNYKDLSHLLIGIYRDFFSEYLNRYADEDGLEKSKVIIGQGYNDLGVQLPSEDNRYLPQAPLSYSDKFGKEVFVLHLEHLGDSIVSLSRDVIEPLPKEVSQNQLDSGQGVAPLSYEDFLSIASLEYTIYKDSGLMQGPFDLENALIAKDINNSYKGRPNLCLKYSGENGEIQGYLIAWQGKLNGETEISEEYIGKECIYIMDVAAKKSNALAGGRLINRFLELYRQFYLVPGKPLPIFAQLRDATSYPLISKQLDRMGDKLRIKFSMTEFETYTVGNDVMHPVIIEPKDLSV